MVQGVGRLRWRGRPTGCAPRPLPIRVHTCHPTRTPKRPSIGPERAWCAIHGGHTVARQTLRKLPRRGGGHTIPGFGAYGPNGVLGAEPLAFYTPHMNRLLAAILTLLLT